MFHCHLERACGPDQLLSLPGDRAMKCVRKFAGNVDAFAPTESAGDNGLERAVLNGDFDDAIVEKHVKIDAD